MVRLRLLVYQVFNEIVLNNYYLSISQYFTLASYYLYINHFDDTCYIFTPNNINLETLREIIPGKIFKREKAKSWQEHTFQQLKALRKDVKRQVEEEEEESDPIYLAELGLMRFISCNLLYGVSQFLIQVHQKTMKQFAEMKNLILPS